MRIAYCFIAFIVWSLTAPGISNADLAYTVKKGESLARISKKFRVDIEKIKEANSLESNRLKPGAKLTIPVAKKSSKNSVVSSRKKASTPTAASSKDNGKDGHVKDASYYTVKKGDTLLSISKKYSIAVEELKELNDIGKSKKLKAGLKLLVKKTGPKTYTVKKGDTLLKIAKKFNMTPDDISFLNELESDGIKPGQKLLLEEWVEPVADVKPYVQILSEAKMSEEIKSLSESPELSSIGITDRLILFAKKMLNIPYRFGGNTLMGIDCSAYVQRVYSFLNVPLPRTAREQFSVGEPVNKEDLSIGDLVFFRTYASFPSHVGIYLGNDLFIHASSRGKKVTIDSLETPYYFKRFIGAKRLLSGEPDLDDQKEFKKEG